MTIEVDPKLEIRLRTGLCHLYAGIEKGVLPGLQTRHRLDHGLVGPYRAMAPIHGRTTILFWCIGKEP